MSIVFFKAKRRHEDLKVKILVPFLVITVFSLLVAACGNSSTPLDAGTRQRIDSTAAAQIRLAREELDSLCKLQQKTVLPRLVDSIKQKRVREIQEQLKTVPK
ncbi:MAG: hypothetical protein H6574_21335 [Lewinellaceae bacterium]|nr:hypothetical protein [Saprospiraceae bacterium]MCB9333608.1 hypothetical protein [Lewinellaceae bacterium]